MLRRLLRLQEPATAQDAWYNLIRAGWWEFGSLMLLVVVAIAARAAFPSGIPAVVSLIVAIFFVPPLICVMAVIREIAATFRLRAQEKEMRPRTGNPLIDHDTLIGVVFVALVVVAAIIYVILKPPR